MRVCLDFNGVLADVAQGLCDRIRHDHGIVVPTKRFSKKLVGSAYPNIIEGSGPKRLTRAMYAAAKAQMFDTEAFLETPAVEGAANAVRELFAHGSKAVVVTDARSLKRERIEAWLAAQGFPYMDVILTRHVPSKEPHQCCCDVVVDNELGHLARLAALDAHPSLVHFMPAPNAAGCDVAVSSSDVRIPSLHGWSEALPHILGLVDRNKLAA